MWPSRRRCHRVPAAAATRRTWRRCKLPSDRALPHFAAESEDDAKDRSQMLGAAGDEAISPAAGLPPRRKRGGGCGAAGKPWVVKQARWQLMLLNQLNTCMRIHPLAAPPHAAWLRAEAVALLAAMLVTGGVVLLAGWLRSAEPGTLLVRPAVDAAHAAHIAHAAALRPCCNSVCALHRRSSLPRRNTTPHPSCLPTPPAAAVGRAPLHAAAAAAV